MPSYVPLVPLPNRGSTGRPQAASSAEPIFSTPLRWTVRVLAWLAFGVASYLAWHAMTQTAVAGCGMGSAAGCDEVLTSSWSKWLGIPVAALGLAFYAAIATFSILLGLRNPAISRWISTAFITLSIAAGIASLWFIGIQVLALGKFCPYCLVTDACGIALGIIAVVIGVRASRGGAGPNANRASLQAGLIGKRPSDSSHSRATPPTHRPAADPPSMRVAAPAALALVALLIGGQLLFATKTYEIETVALTKSINLGASKNTDASADANAKPYVTQRVPTETETPSSADHENATSKSATSP